MRLPAALTSRRFLVRAAFIGAILLWPVIGSSGFTLSVMTLAGVYAMMSLGLGLLLGQAGQISLGHAAFFGIGAFTAGVLTTEFAWPPVPALLAGAFLAGFVAYVVGRPILKLKSYFLALATLGLGEIFVVIAHQNKIFFDGGIGVVGVPYFGVPGFTFDTYMRQYYLVWVLVLALLLLTERALASRVGRSLRALSTSEIAASTLGVHTAGWKLRAFVLSAGYAGLGGGLYAFVVSAVNYSNFTGSLSLLVMIMVMVGGVSSLLGAVGGAILISWLGYAFTDYQQYSGALYAIVLILLLLFLPGGLAAGLEGRYVDALRLRVRGFVSRLAARVPLLGRWSTSRGASADHAKPSLTILDVAGGGMPLAEAIERWRMGASDDSGPSAPRDPASFLRLEEVSVFFGGVAAVDKVSLTFEEGAISGLLGPNGAGKTTLFNVISGLQKPSKGHLWFREQPIDGRRPDDVSRLGIARTFQNLRLFGNMSVLENVMVGRHRHEKAGFLTAALGLQANEERESRRRSLDALAVVGLEHMADRPVAALPYGQQRLTEIARALATEPRLLLLDEPAAGMNATEKIQLVERVAAIRKAGVTVIMVEHDLGMVMGITDNVSVLNFGCLMANGHPTAVQTDPAVIEAYVGVKHGDQYGLDEMTLRAADEARARRDAGGAPVLEVQNLCTNYGSISAIRDISLRVFPGEIVAVLGSNGAGKTTLLRTISGLLGAREGSVLYEGRDISNMRPKDIADLGIGQVPEGRHIFPTLSVRDNLMLGTVCRQDKSGMREDLDWVFELFPVLAERRDQWAGTMSGGQQQMLAIGRGLMGRPKVLLLDEPSMGLAPQNIEIIFKALVKLNAEGLTMLVVEQNAEMLLSIAHHAFVLQTGRVALSGGATDLACDERVKGLYLGHADEACVEDDLNGPISIGKERL